MGNKNYEVITECVAIKDEYMYCVAREMNIIFKINKESLQVEIMTNMPNEDNMVDRLYLGIYIEGDDMILVPCNAKKLWVYNFVTCTWKGLALDDFVDPNMEAKFVGGALKNGMAYLYGFKYKGILKVNVKSGEITELLEKQGEYAFWGESTVELENKLYVANRLENNVICIDTNDSEWEKLPILGCGQSDKNKNEGMAYVNNQFYIIPHHGDYFIEWNQNKTSYRIKTNEIFDTNKNFFNGIAASENYIYLYGPDGKSYIYNIKKPKESYILKESVYFAKYFLNVGFVVCKKGIIAIYDSELHRLKQIPLQVSEFVRDKYIERCKMSRSVLRENKIIGLKEFVDILKAE